MIMSGNIPEEESPSRDGLQPLSAEENARAGTYRLLAVLLGGPPDEETLAVVSGLPSGNNCIGANVAQLAKRSRQVNPEKVEREFHKLFIGLGEGEIVPYGSYYLSGFLHEKPLARLRVDLRKLGVERDSNFCEPEDCIASVCEVMSGLISGDFGTPASLSLQRDFFTKHVGSWGGQFFVDLESASSAYFYRPVGSLGRNFIQLEAEAFSIEN